jgi:hypothetical protein
MTLLGFESGRVTNSVADVDALLSRDPQEILTLSAESLYPYVGDLGILIRVMKDVVPKNYGPTWRFNSIELGTSIEFVRAVVANYEARLSSSVVCYDKTGIDSPVDTLPDLSFEDLSLLLFGMDAPS